MERIENAVKRAIIVCKDIFLIDSICVDKSIDSEVSVLKNVSKYSVEEAVSLILSNNNATIYKIEYCVEENTLIFYSDNELDTSFWENRLSSIQYEKFEEAVNELKEKLENPEECPKDCVSVMWLLESLRHMYLNSLNSEDKIIEKIEDKLKSVKFSIGSSDVIISFDKIEYKKYFTKFSNKNILNFNLSRSRSLMFKSDEDFELDYNDGNVIVKNNRYSSAILRNLGDELLELLNHQIKYFPFLSLHDRIKFFKSGLNIDVGSESAEIDIKFKDGFYKISYDYTDEFQMESEQFLATKIINGNEEAIMQRLYVRIDDCPEFLREELFKRKHEEKIALPQPVNTFSLPKLINQPETEKELEEIKNPIATFIDQQKEIYDKKAEIKAMQITKNIIEYLKTKSLMREINLYSLDINDICDFDKLKKIISIFYVEGIQIIKLDNPYMHKVFINIVYDKGQILEVSSDEILYNILVELIYKNAMNIAKTNFNTAGFIHDCWANLPQLVISEDIQFKVDTNLKHLMAIKNELLYPQAYDYDPTIDYSISKEDNITKQIGLM